MRQGFQEHEAPLANRFLVEMHRTLSGAPQSGEECYERPIELAERVSRLVDDFRRESAIAERESQNDARRRVERIRVPRPSGRAYAALRR